MMFNQSCNSDHQPTKNDHKVKENPHMEDNHLTSNLGYF